MLFFVTAARRGFSILALIKFEVSFFDLTEKVLGDRGKIPELSYSFRSSHEGILDSLYEFQHIVTSKCFAPYEIFSKFYLVELSSCLIQHRRLLKSQILFADVLRMTDDD